MIVESLNGLKISFTSLKAEIVNSTSGNELTNGMIKKGFYKYSFILLVKKYTCLPLERLYMESLIDDALSSSHEMISNQIHEIVAKG